MKREDIYDIAYVILFFVVTYIVFTILQYGVNAQVIQEIFTHPLTLAILFIMSFICLSLGIRIVTVYHGIMKSLGVALIFLGGLIILYVLSRIAIMFEHSLKEFLSWLS